MDRTDRNREQEKEGKDSMEWKESREERETGRFAMLPVTVTRAGYMRHVLFQVELVNPN